MIGTSGRRAFALEELKPAHSRHIDVGQDQNERPVACIADALKCHGGGLRKFHCEAVGAEVAPELLAKQQLDIRLVVDHENERVHMRSPDLTRNAPARRQQDP